MNMNNQEKNNYVRTQITNTLLEMMQEQPFEKISISELVSRAMVGRASFYRNYMDKQDVLRQECDRLMKEWGGELKLDNQNTSETLISLLDFIKLHSEFYTTLYKAEQDDILRVCILSKYAVDEETPNIVAYLSSSIAYMTYGWIHEWIKRGMQESGTELARMLESAQK